MQPGAVAVSEGELASFSVSVTGDPAPTFQWRRDGVVIPRATNSVLNISSVTSSDAGIYAVVISNASGDATSADGTLVVNPPANVSVTTQPLSADVVAGASATLSVVASSSESITYQ